MTEHPRPLPAEPAEEFSERSHPVDEHMAGQRRKDDTRDADRDQRNPDNPQDDRHPGL